MDLLKKELKKLLKKTDIARKDIILSNPDAVAKTLLLAISANLANISLSSYDKFDDTKELVKYLESIINNETFDDKKDLITLLGKTKTEQIYRLKRLNDNFSAPEKKSKFLKELINQLELLEVSALYTNADKTIKINQDIVNSIIFEQQNYYNSKYLISHYPYMINIYNEGDKILDKVIDKYIQLVEKYARERTDKKELYYYDNILEMLLDTEKIKISDEDIQKAIEKIKNNFEEKNYIGKEKERLILWFNHLVTILEDRNYEIDKETLNHLYGVRSYYKKAILDEANLYLITNKPKRIDEKTETIITIDGSETFNRDDALSIVKNEEGNYILKIYIADPNSYFNKDSLIMEEARKRTQTIYNELNPSGMFPEDIVSNYLSLDEGKARYMRVYRYEIDKTNGEVISFRMEKQVRETDVNLTYEQANEIIKTGEENLECFRTICLLGELKQLLKQKYIKRIILNENDPEENRNYGSSEELIATLMIFNNNQVAKYFKEHNLPFIYRHQESKKKIDSFIDFSTLSNKDKNKFESIIEEIEKNNQEVEYSNTKSNHDALGLSEYSHTTSPNRRYPDILAADCIDTFIFHNPTDKEAYAFEEELKDKTNFINTRNNEILEYYRKSSRVRR